MKAQLTIDGAKVSVDAKRPSLLFSYWFWNHTRKVCEYDRYNSLGAEENDIGCTSLSRGMLESTVLNIEYISCYFGGSMMISSESAYE
jgi:hypothetical protein